MTTPFPCGPPSWRSSEPGTERKRYAYTSVPITVKKIFWTTIAPSTPGRFARGMIATNMSSITAVPMFAGRKPFRATPAA